MYILWNHREPSIAKNHLYTTLSYCRKAFKDIGIDNIIEYNLESYKLNYNDIWWDYEILVGKLDKTNTSFTSKEDLLEIISLDRGMYMENSDYLWAINTREFLNIQLNKIYNKHIENPELSEDTHNKILECIKIHGII